MLGLKEKPPAKKPEGVSGLIKNLKHQDKENYTTALTRWEDDILDPRKIKDIFDISDTEDDPSEDVREPQLIPIEPFPQDCPWLLLQIDRLCTEESLISRGEIPA